MLIGDTHREASMTLRDATTLRDDGAGVICSLLFRFSREMTALRRRMIIGAGAACAGCCRATTPGSPQGSARTMRCFHLPLRLPLAGAGMSWPGDRCCRFVSQKASVRRARYWRVIRADDVDGLIDIMWARHAAFIR